MCVFVCVRECACVCVCVCACVCACVCERVVFMRGASTLLGIVWVCE